MHYDQIENIFVEKVEIPNMKKDNSLKNENIRLKKENSVLKKQMQFWKNGSRRLGLENASIKRVFAKNIACRTRTKDEIEEMLTKCKAFQEALNHKIALLNLKLMNITSKCSGNETKNELPFNHSNSRL